MHSVLTAIVFLPLIGALIAGLFGTSLFKGLGRDADVYGDHQAHAHDAHAGHDHDNDGGSASELPHYQPIVFLVNSVQRARHKS